MRLAMSLWLVLTLVVLVSSAGIKAVEEDIHHGTPIKHGKQERDIDGHHNVHFDHEAILGSYKLEQEFDELAPEEAQKRLGMLFKKMDADQDFFVTKQELSDWIMMSFRLLDEEEAVEDMGEKDQDGDGRVTWLEYLKAHFSYTENDIKEMRKSDREDILQFLVGVDEEERKFNTADVNKDGALVQTEYIAFYHPYNYEHMHQVELQRTMREHDKNQDGFLSLDEYMGGNNHDKEWEAVEKERFAEFDRTKDGLLNFDEIKPWILTDNREEAEEEAGHLVKLADVNGDGRLTEREMVEAHEEFVGSQATDYGHQLHFIKHRDEL